MEINPALEDEGQVSSITSIEYSHIRKMLTDLTGIELGPNKQVLVTSRLRKSMLFHGFLSFSDYIHLVKHDEAIEEKQIMIDLLTTNETYFFREKAHFQYMREKILPKVSKGQTLRFWSAACSSGEEAYSAAMTIDDTLNGLAWEVVASDVNQQVLKSAKQGVYPIKRLELMSKKYLHDYCLKGFGPYHGSFLIQPAFKKKVLFSQVNLIKPLNRPDFSRHLIAL